MKYNCQPSLIRSYSISTSYSEFILSASLPPQNYALTPMTGGVCWEEDLSAGQQHYSPTTTWYTNHPTRNTSGYEETYRANSIFRDLLLIFTHIFCQYMGRGDEDEGGGALYAFWLKLIDGISTISLYCTITYFSYLQTDHYRFAFMHSHLSCKISRWSVNLVIPYTLNLR